SRFSKRARRATNRSTPLPTSSCLTSLPGSSYPGKLPILERTALPLSRDRRLGCLPQKALSTKKAGVHYCTVFLWFPVHNPYADTTILYARLALQHPAN